MTLKIDKKITGVTVVTEEESKVNVVSMDESVDRPEALFGSTYKVKTPLSDHSMYVTINDIVLNHGTEHEVRRPFEMFINSKNMEHFQWMVALTRIISAVFRKGGDIAFLVEELESVFDPNGGYFKKGGKFMPSLVAEIGLVLKQHLVETGVMEGETLDESQKKLIEDKRAEYEAKQETKSDAFPDGATLCGKCNTKAVIIMDGCATCLNCGDSKCG